MQVINTNGMSLFGPGSEWFWTMLQFVLVAVTLVGIYHQLRLARSANAFQQLDRITDSWASERAVRHRLTILLALRNGAAAEDIPEGSAAYIADFWEQAASLVRAGHVDRRVIFDQYEGTIRLWWAIVEPNTMRYRAETGDMSGEHFEWLASEMGRIGASLPGHQVAYNAAYLASTLDRRIEMLQEQARLAEALRTVHIAGPPVAAGMTQVD